MWIGPPSTPEDYVYRMRQSVPIVIIDASGDTVLRKQMEEKATRMMQEYYQKRRKYIGEEILQVMEKGDMERVGFLERVLKIMDQQKM